MVQTPTVLHRKRPVHKSQTSPGGRTSRDTRPQGQNRHRSSSPPVSTRLPVITPEDASNRTEDMDSVDTSLLPQENDSLPTTPQSNVIVSTGNDAQSVGQWIRWDGSRVVETPPVRLPTRYYGYLPPSTRPPGPLDYVCTHLHFCVHKSFPRTPVTVRAVPLVSCRGWTYDRRRVTRHTRCVSPVKGTSGPHPHPRPAVESQRNGRDLLGWG